MADSPERILTTHVGSLARPPEVVEHIVALEAGRPVDAAALDRILTEAVAAVVRRQHEAGVDIVSDGEFSKVRSWSRYVLDRLSGLEERDMVAQIPVGKDARTFPEFYAEYFGRRPMAKRGVLVATGPIAYTGAAAVQADIDRFKAGLKGVAVAGAFLPAVAPASAIPIHGNDYYRSEEELLFALAEALREEYRAIVDAGLDVQVDDAFIPFMYDVAFTDRDMSDYRKWVELQIDALNHALAGLPEERIRYHICWGSFHTPHTADVPIRAIVDLITRVKAGAYCIEMANARHEHEWRVWEDAKLPEGRKLVPGVVTHSTNVVEHPDLVAERLVRLAKLVGRDNVMAGTDCGFATPTRPRVHESIQWAKLESLAEGARRASAELWGRRAA